MKTFAIGDIHGGYRALVQCLERSQFNKAEDRLIVLGDVCDGWCEVRQCVDELVEMDTIALIGNHDEWFKNWMTTGIHADHWKQGGLGTALSYLRPLLKEHLVAPNYADGGFLVALNPDDIPPAHWQFFMHMRPYVVDEANRLFVHAGFVRKHTIQETAQRWPYLLYWDRDLWESARSCSDTQLLKTKEGFAKIFIGHTTCSHIDDMKPVLSGGVWNLDTGGGWEGKLTIMNVDTEKYWQSDKLSDLYKDFGDHSLHYSKKYR